jgi:peptide methionine sulfoxide reductase MsrA
MVEKENIKLSGKVVTKISLVKNYCTAEEYHQRYLEKR